MTNERKIAFDNISRVLAIRRYDIEHHQLVNDQSLNIHGEDWFRDIFNFVYQKNFINANLDTKTGNSAAVDLIDKEKKLAYQITTTRSKEKVDDTLKKIQKTPYKDYELKIFFLLEKSKFNKNTKKYFKDEYSIENIEEYLFDYTDLLKDIEALETNNLIELNQKLFLKTAEKYTDNIVLNLIFKHLLKEKKNIKIDFDDDFGTIDTNKKLELNNIKPRIALEINKGLDYRVIIDRYKEEDNLLTDLKDYIIDDLYKNILIEVLEKKVSKKELLDKKTFELQDIASTHEIVFNKLINKLHEKIESNIEINDWNSMGIAMDYYCLFL
ncbi:MAG: SMEK domain-containing protein [Sulfurovum sp.]|nr:SMEK domain-containing protein [Sulfurovum sp.]